MPEKKTVTFRIEDGKIQPRSRARWFLTVWLPDVLPLFGDGRVVFSVEKPTRSLDQNSRYWAMLTEIAKAFREAGVTQWHIMGPGGEMIRLPVNKDTLHGWFKRKYITPDDPEKTPTTTTLSETAFSDYLENIKHDEDVRKLDLVFRDQDQLADA